jgi:hypothetical protein
MIVRWAWLSALACLVVSCGGSSTGPLGTSGDASVGATCGATGSACQGGGQCCSGSCDTAQGACASTVPAVAGPDGHWAMAGNSNCQPIPPIISLHSHVCEKAGPYPLTIMR